MKLEGITGIIFDLGGTLYKPVSDMCGLTREFLINAGHGEGKDFPDADILAATQAPDEWLNNYMIENDVDIHWKPELEHWIEYDRRLFSALGIKDHENVVHDYQREWDRFHEIATHELIEDCKECLEELKGRGFKLGIASNRFTDPARVLEDSGIHHLFDVVEYTNVPKYRKPNPYMLLRVAAAFGTSPHRCAYVGNIVEYDVVVATRAGMIPVLLTWCDPQEEEKVSLDTVVIKHIKDLLEIF